MISVEEAVEKLKDIVSFDVRKNTEITDKHIAKALCMPSSKLRSYIYTNNLPMLEITKYLLEKNVNVNEFFSKNFECEEVLNHDKTKS